MKNNLSHIFINFIPRASHLWFIYMLLGIYLINACTVSVVGTVSAVVKKRCSWVSGCLLHYSGMLMRFSEMFLGNVGGIHILCFITYLVMWDMW